MALSSRYDREVKILRDMLVEERKKRRVTQVSLSSKLRIPQSDISKLETGERRLDLLSYIRMARAVGYEPGALITRLAKKI